MTLVLRGRCETKQAMRPALQFSSPAFAKRGSLFDAMTELEQAAVAFIHARDAKARAKAARNAVRCTEEAAGGPDDAGIPACWRGFNVGDSEDDLCDACKERQKLHYEVNRLTPVATSALARLRTAVRRSEK